MWGPGHTRHIASCRSGPRGPTQHLAAVQSEIEGADDVAEVDRSVVRRALHVGTGPHRTDGVMEHLGGDRSQEETAEWSVPVGGHDRSEERRVGKEWRSRG